MKLYIAGKITGDDNYKAKFEAARKQLEAEGHTAISPAVLPSGMNNADYMRICFAMIDTADGVVFLPDYTDSPGAQVELQYCRYIGKNVMFGEWEVNI